MRGPNFTKLGEDIRPSSLLTEFVSELRYLAKLRDVENEAKFRTFSPPVKIKEGVGEISGLRFKALPMNERGI